MGYGPSLASAIRYERLGVGTGTGANISPSVGSKGSYSTIGTTGFDYDGFYANFSLPGAQSGKRYRIDVAINTGGSDQIIVADWYLSSDGTDNPPLVAYFPVRIPTGATIKCRAYVNASGTANVGLFIQGFQSSRLVRGFSRAISCVDWTSIDPANTVTLTGTTPSAWCQVMSSTPNRIAGLYAHIDNLGTSTGSQQLKIDVGWGLSGSERVIFSRFLALVRPCTYTDGTVYPCDIPAGSRLVARGTASASDSQSFGVVLLGLVP